MGKQGTSLMYMDSSVIMSWLVGFISAEKLRSLDLFKEVVFSEVPSVCPLKGFDWLKSHMSLSLYMYWLQRSQPHSQVVIHGRTWE